MAANAEVVRFLEVYRGVSEINFSARSRNFFSRRGIWFEGGSLTMRQLCEGLGIPPAQLAPIFSSGLKGTGSYDELGTLPNDRTHFRRFADLLGKVVHVWSQDGGTGDHTPFITVVPAGNLSEDQRLLKECAHAFITLAAHATRIGRNFGSECGDPTGATILGWSARNAMAADFSAAEIPALMEQCDQIVLEPQVALFEWWVHNRLTELDRLRQENAVLREQGGARQAAALVTAPQRAAAARERGTTRPPRRGGAY